MKKGSTSVLKILVLLIATFVLFGLIKFPQTEGRAANLDLLNIYMDPFILYIYVASIPFFVGLYQVFKLLGLIEQNKVFSKNAVVALRNIRNCALINIVFVIGAALFIRFTVTDDDPAGFIALCILVSTTSLIVAIGASIFAKLFQKRIKNA